MNENYQNKEDKTSDFVIGFFINVGIIVAAFCLYWVFYAIGLDTGLSNISKGIAISIVLILLAIIEFLLIKKHLKARRYIAIGMIVAFIVPLLVFGACSPFLFSL